MGNDPFADDPFEGAEGGVATAVREPAVSHIGITLKRGGGFDEPWITIKAPDVGTGKEMLRDIVRAELHEDVSKAADMFAGLGGGSGPARGGGGGGFKKKPAQDDGPPPGVDQEYCKHGDMQYKAGKKNGKQWSGWFCPDDDCKVIWL